MLKNPREDSKKNKHWPQKGAWKAKFWKKQLEKAVNQVNRDKEFFKNQYKSYKERCQKFIESKGKRFVGEKVTAACGREGRSAKKLIVFSRGRKVKTRR